MKTTMKNHGHFYKIKIAVQKITMQLVTASLILAFTACEKEEIFETDQKVHEVDESIKGIARIDPRLSLEIRLRTHTAPYSFLRENSTVKLNDNFYAVSRESNVTKIWSSPNGLDWTLKRNNPFPMEVRIMVAHDDKIWAIGFSGYRGQLEIYSSRNGYSWSHVTSSLPFALYNLDSAVVFNNKIFVFEDNQTTGGQRIHSSSNGINWTLETANAYPERGHGTPIVFKNTLYYLGGSGINSGRLNEIWKSTNGRDWSRVRTLRPLNSVAQDFPVKAGHAAVVHNNKVWVTGGFPIGEEEDVTNTKEIWYSGDMKNWSKYTGKVSFKTLTVPTMLSYNNEILLLGGIDWSGMGEQHVRSIWSIKSKKSVRFPVQIPRPDRHNIPRF